MKCPDLNTLSEFVDGKLFDEKYADVFAHIAVCPECRDYCSFALDAIASEKSGKQIKISEKIKTEILNKINEISAIDINQVISEQWNNFVNYFSELFLQYENAEVVATSENIAELMFASSNEENKKYEWEMILYIPAQISKTLDITLETPKTKTASGKLIFCGNEIDIKNGKGSILYEDLKNSFNNPYVAFIFEDKTKVSGYPRL